MMKLRRIVKEVTGRIPIYLISFVVILIIGGFLLMLRKGEEPRKFRQCEEHKEFQENSSGHPIEIPLKTILIWNSPERIVTRIFGNDPEDFVRHDCSFTRCKIFPNRTQLPLEFFDAIIVNVAVPSYTSLPKSTRRDQQRFILLTQEPPTLMRNRIDSFIVNYVNWTMTYRMDSDIKLLYGRIRPKESAPKSTEEAFDFIKKVQPKMINKTKLVTGMISHCPTPSHREDYITQLKKYIDVDIYGQCGSFSCPRLNNGHWFPTPHCYKMMEISYKFYLSFENSICQDYATEKFFNIFKYNMIPVVFGGANYSQLAPPHSFIDARQFTPKHLADYLKLLDANDTLYNEYFWWKDHYQVEAGVEQMARHGFCDLCEKLHTDHVAKVYQHQLISNWDQTVQCSSGKINV